MQKRAVVVQRRGRREPSQRPYPRYAVSEVGGTCQRIRVDHCLLVIIFPTSSSRPGFVTHVRILYDLTVIHTWNHSAERWLTLESEFPSRRSNYTSRTLLLSRCRSCAKRHEESYLSRRRRRHDNTLVRLLKLWGRRLDCKCVWDGVFPFIGCGISFSSCLAVPGRRLLRLKVCTTGFTYSSRGRTSTHMWVLSPPSHSDVSRLTNSSGRLSRCSLRVNKDA